MKAKLIAGVLAGVLAGAFLLAGCESIDTARDLIKQKGAKLADEGLTDAEWLVCSASSIGAIKRRYGRTVERADTYKEFCDGAGQANVIAPPAPE